MANLNRDQVNQARTLLESSKAILIALPANPSFDAVAAALSFYLSLSAAGKQISMVSATEMTVGYNELVGVDKIGKAIGSQNGRNLIISFPYQEGSIEKVSYNIENDTFNLVIEPREGYPPITPEMMQYNYSGGATDCIITVGASKLDDLDSLYNGNQSLFNEKPLINIDVAGNNQKYGKANIIDTSASSISELAATLISEMGLSLEPDIATNLMMGLSEETNNFASPEVTAATFETAALLLKNGARQKQSQAKTGQNLPQFPRQDQSQKPFSFARPQRPFQRQPVSGQQQQTQQQQQPFRPKTQPQQQPKQQQQGQSPSVREAGSPPETPPDWLKPKIYKGSTLL
ncbi:MAG: exopolyphosphatase-like protein, phosphoesterase RecJ domain-containing protein [Candidatus Gottesmanbacteria bacterium GW2011_GWA2_43_14]|uniref:Exopolyphosphatase-like protein, phosphoesterase RecJ domain-containing protein n=1 Tax=Candidatus Gottesmanbacteria bacterium GW2011_GWA2_43_14 TaxID=1618443 RepID=A0A0G1DEE3_9BACT|nr:MAG: exopolyphosphatase-like protein, phosphoesterase RecJ domain-containing protein [Candidatus Gottesmanbacteria bacterium GW2011_GWA2_43_14]